MKTQIAVRPSDFWRWDGKVDRGPYLLIGSVLLTFKFFLDRFVSATFFGRQWSIFDYVVPARAFDLASFPESELKFYGTMLFISLPFAWTGCVLTIRRLRACRFPPWLVLLFFVPAINLILFKVLLLTPTRQEEEDLSLTGPPGEGGWSVLPAKIDEPAAALPAAAGTRDLVRLERERGLFASVRRTMDRVIPEDTIGSAVFALLAPLPFASVITFLCISVLKSYGWGLFVALPFVLPLVSVLLFGYRQTRPMRECLIIGWCSVTILAVVLFCVAIEGAICLVMALPLAWLVASMGAALGYLIQNRPMKAIETTKMLLALAMSVPVLMGAEYADRPQAPLYAVRTSVDVAAPAALVWHNVVSFAKIDEPLDWLFRLGIAYPIKAEIFGRGPGAIRHCTFSTGTFVEPIQVWHEPELLKFSVTTQPEPMTELSFDPRIHPPHLDNYLVSRGGQFRLTRLAPGSTHLEGTTWYQHHMWPAAYWQIWSDFIIHRIHARVLNHIKTLSEET